MRRRPCSRWPRCAGCRSVPDVVDQPVLPSVTVVQVAARSRLILTLTEPVALSVYATYTFAPAAATVGKSTRPVSEVSRLVVLQPVLDPWFGVAAQVEDTWRRRPIRDPAGGGDPGRVDVLAARSEGAAGAVLRRWVEALGRRERRAAVARADIVDAGVRSVVVDPRAGDPIGRIGRVQVGAPSCSPSGRATGRGCMRSSAPDRRPPRHLRHWRDARCGQRERCARLGTCRCRSPAAPCAHRSPWAPP